MCRFFKENTRALRFMAFAFLITSAIVLIDSEEHEGAKLLLLALLILSFDEGYRNRMAEEPAPFEKVLRV